MRSMTVPAAWRRAAALLVLLLAAWSFPAQAQVTITFWSQETGTKFPHAFFTLHGTREASGEPVDLSYGFTAKAITPAILMGSVAGRIDETDPRYIMRSNAHFSAVLTDTQYDAVLRLVEEWGEQGDHHYNLNRRNCVHFIAEAARRAGLVVIEPKKLMKKPRSFTQSLVPLNAGRVLALDVPAKQYYAQLGREAPGAIAMAK
jgi:hypothetical protein